MENRGEMSLFQLVKEAASDTFLREWNGDKFIDRGSFGAVYRISKEGSLGSQQSALKIIELSPDTINKYKSEIMALQSIRSEKHAVRIEDFSEVHIGSGKLERAFLIVRMELLKPLPKDGMSEDEVIRMGIELCEVLSKCHMSTPRILHCDIKPDNILISQNGDYKLSDFGEARVLDKSQSKGSSGGRGTPYYISPEMHNYQGYDQKSDLYSLGVTMYTMLNGGQVPFYELGEREAIAKRLRGERFPTIPNVSAELQRIVRNLCQIDPTKRYQSARTLSADLLALRKRKRDAEEARIRKEEQDKAKAEAARRQAEERERERLAAEKKRKEEQLRRAAEEYEKRRREYEELNSAQSAAPVGGSFVYDDPDATISSDARPPWQ